MIVCPSFPSSTIHQRLFPSWLVQCKTPTPWLSFIGPRPGPTHTQGWQSLSVPGRWPSYWPARCLKSGGRCGHRGKRYRCKTPMRESLIRDLQISYKAAIQDGSAESWGLRMPMVSILIMTMRLSSCQRVTPLKTLLPTPQSIIHWTWSVYLDLQLILLHSCCWSWLGWKLSPASRQQRSLVERGTP